MKKFFIFFSIIVSLFFIDDIYATYNINISDYTDGDLLLHQYSYKNGLYTWGNVIDNYIDFDLGIDDVHGGSISVKFQQVPAGKHVLGVRNDLMGGHLYKTNIFYCYNQGQSLTVRDFHIIKVNGSNISSLYHTNGSIISPFGPNTGAWATYSCQNRTFYYSPTDSATYDIILDYTASNQYINFAKWKIEDLGLSDSGIATIVSDVLKNELSGIDDINQSVQDVNQSVQDSIDNANKNHQEQMDQEQKNHDDFMNSDSDSSFNEDTSSYDEYEKAEKDLMDSTNVDTSDLNFDISSYSKPFKWIWDTITSFFQSSSKVFMAVTSTLILSFVGLVVGRG